jgi:hypothetical protein
MGLDKKDKAFRLAKISYVDFKHIEIERTLLNLFPRLKHDGYPGRIRNGSRLLTIKDFLEAFIHEKNKHQFIGFAEHEDIVGKWLETDLLDLVNRGRSTQSVVSPRPLHGNAYKYRNTKYARDYGSSEHIYWMLYHARKSLGQGVRDSLKDFIFAGLDQQTNRLLISDQRIDVETQAILHFDELAEVKDVENRSEELDKYSPLCVGQADLLAEDVLRLLTYEKYMPRSVLVDYLKTLFSFHLGLYHLRLLKLLPALVRRCGSDPICDRCPITPSAAFPHGDCPHRIGLVVDLGDPANPHMTELARRSADTHYRRIPTYIEAHFITKKLDEMANYLNTRGKLSPVDGDFSIGEVLQLLDTPNKGEREAFAKSRLIPLIERYQQGQDSSVPPEVQRILNLGLGDFDTYIEILVALRGTYHREAIIKCLDSLLLKNSDSGLLRQSRAKGSPRWFALGSRLLEVLLQIAVLELKGTAFVTREIRVDELLMFLRERYGLYVDRLPPGDGFEQPSIVDQQALRKNVAAFKTRLREIGFFQDLSDAYVTQTVTPRYTITAENSGI